MILFRKKPEKYHRSIINREKYHKKQASIIRNRRNIERKRTNHRTKCINYTHEHGHSNPRTRVRMTTYTGMRDQNDG